MAKQEKNQGLLNQTITRLLEFQGVPVSKGTGHLQLLQPTIPQPLQNYTDSHSTSANTVIPLRTRKQINNRHFKKWSIGSLIFISIAWILLVSNFLIIMGNSDYGRRGSLSLETLNMTGERLFQLCVLAFGALVLTLTTFLILMKRLDNTKKIVTILIISLSVSLVFLITTSDNKSIDLGILGRFFSTLFPAKHYTANNVINGIIFSRDNQSVVIGSHVLHEGDALYGVNVFKINKDKVEFEKSGTKWTQVIHQKPKAFWK